MNVKIETHRFEHSQNVTGPIWIEVAGRSFPDSHWTDFPVIILGWWLQEFHNLSTGKVNRIECYFMDGPYRFEIVSSESLWTVTCRRDEESEVLIETPVKNIEDFIRSTVEAAQSVIKLCEDRGWLSVDLDQLRTASAKFNLK